ncbi:hypothetical protein ULMS_25880 [Patiriisocius marinistellae]|uniref:Uncharacterized protein n=1 Tax=Patiriisocius marinistellae TaxID=2494560 RepID=A0A5J4FXS2_9FLAO|nr:hypothetical protein [Patiriisocius marinistellae]GEQ87080.1 hypothetical protein ULMS_25880 [Patiriisocius marinistellae]
MSLKIATILLLAAITSCQSISINDIEKKIVTASRPGQSLTFQYSLTMTIKEDVMLKSIMYKNASKPINFSISRLPDGLVMSNSEMLQSGIYYITAIAAFDESIKSSNDTLLFNFENSSNKTFTFQKETVWKGNLLTK